MSEAGFFRMIAGLWRYLWPYGHPNLQFRVLIAFCLVFLSKGLVVFVPYVFKFTVDALLLEDAASQETATFFSLPILFVGAYGLARMFSVCFHQLREILFAKVTMHVVRDVALMAFAHLQGLSLRFHLERRIGALSQLLERGRAGVEQLTRLLMMQFLPTIVEFFLVMGLVAFEFNFYYAMIIFLTISAYVLFTVKAMQWRINIRVRMNESDMEANARALDSLINYETVKYFCAEETEKNRYDSSLEMYEKAGTDTYISLAVLNSGQTIIFTIGLTLCMALSAKNVLNGVETPGQFVMINALLLQLAQPLNFIGTIYREIRQSIIDTDNLFKLIDKDVEIKDAPNAKPLNPVPGAIAFENVFFSYTAMRPILKGISFEVPAGKTVAIVGPSGAGKSTIARLVFRFYEASSGRITVNGQDVRDVTLASLRGAIGIVPQDTVLFNDNLMYNIRYGRIGASDQEVCAAAQAAQLDAFIKNLPEGYATPVGERGLKLSGGEKQRVAIARTVLKDAQILILDEATSALDTFTEHEIQGALEMISAKSTTLVIAHRLSTVVNADKIIVLSDGGVVEEGDHETLLLKKGVYSEMWQRQLDEDVVEDLSNRAAPTTRER